VGQAPADSVAGGEAFILREPGVLKFTGIGKRLAVTARFFPSRMVSDEAASDNAQLPHGIAPSILPRGRILRHLMTQRRDSPKRPDMIDDAAPEAAQPALPDRLSVNPRSPHYNEDVLALNVGIKINGQEKTNVEEYCVSEGWIKVAVGKTLDRKGNPLTLTVKGVVEPYIKGKQ